LAVRPLASHDTAKAAQVALALSYVRDPVAVPYLVQPLASPLFLPRDIAIRALGRFATREAVEALIVVLGTSGPDATTARVTLGMVEPRIEEAALRERVHAALANTQQR
jgi:HEAT repeat protein